MGGRAWTDEEIAVLHELYPTKPWRVVLEALPGRTLEAARCKVCELGIKRKKNSRTPWLGSEIAALRKLYPNRPWTEICAAIPRHPRPSIGKKANELGLKRDHAMKQSRYRLIRELRAARRAAGITQQAVARLVGTLPVQIAKWERGETTPRFASFLDWAEAMGFRVELRRY